MRARRGQSTTEFAMSVTVFLTLLFSVMQMARTLYTYTWVAYAARSGTRYGIVHGSSSSTPSQATATANIQSLVQGLAAQVGPANIHCPVASPNDLCVITTWTPNNQPGSTVQVQVVYNFQYTIPLLTSATRALTSTSKMVISQ